ncbi:MULTISPECIES: transposase, partial [unclassified Shinella]|uniref:transposase n=1 Tax=unclassified Shinella TaxID=2643062 RepID=UPI001FDA65FE
MKRAEALDDRASFRWFCSFSRSEQTPERTAFVRPRLSLVAHGLDKSLFDMLTETRNSSHSHCARSHRRQRTTPSR